jgi:hypothetical protein
MQKKNSSLLNEIMEMRKIKAENESKISFDSEKINYLSRETALK